MEMNGLIKSEFNGRWLFQMTLDELILNLISSSLKLPHSLIVCVPHLPPTIPLPLFLFLTTIQASKAYVMMSSLIFLTSTGS